MVIVWALLLVLAILFVQFLIFHNFVLKHISYSRQILQKTAFEYEHCYLEEKIENNKRLWIPWLYVESQIDIHLQFGKQENLFVSTGTHYQNHASFFMLRGYQRITRTHRLIPTKRGVYDLKTVTLTSGDVLGFSKRAMQLQLEQTHPLVVYPKPIIPQIRIDSRDYSLGDVIVKRFIMPDPFLIAGTRAYVPGDTFKSINWQATARTQALQTNQYEYSSNKRLMVLINCEDHEEMWKTVNNVEQIENYIRYTAGLTELALSEGIEAGFACNMPSLQGNEEITVVLPQKGQAYWYSILESLAQIKIERSLPFSDLMEQLLSYTSEPIEFVIFSTYWNDKLEALAQQLRYKQHQVYHVPAYDQTLDQDIDEQEVK